jgi:hypothetical protein
MAGQTSQCLSSGKKHKLKPKGAAMPPFYLAESNLTKDIIVEYYTWDINLSTSYYI